MKLNRPQSTHTLLTHERLTWCMCWFSSLLKNSDMSRFRLKLFSTTLNLNVRVFLCYNLIYITTLILFVIFSSSSSFAANSKLIHQLHNSEHPTSVFSILDTGTKQIPLVADSLFDLLILKMQPAYSSKKQTKVRNKANTKLSLPVFQLFSI